MTALFVDGPRACGGLLLALLLLTPARAEPTAAPVQPVHVFLIHGLDPLDLGGLHDLRDFIASQPVASVSLHQFFQSGEVRRGIVTKRACDPSCRIVVVGFSAGALTARRLVATLHEHDGIDVDLLVYLGGGFVDDSAFSRPEYVPDVVHILADTLMFRGGPIHDADNYRILGIGHFDSPMHPVTLAVLSDRLHLLATPCLAPSHMPASTAPTPTQMKPVSHVTVEIDPGEVIVVGDEPPQLGARLLPPRPVMRGH